MSDCSLSSEERSGSHSSSHKLGNEEVPPRFLCPISCTLMGDPVRIQSGMVYARAAIETWFRQGHATCPLTRQKVDAFSLEPDEGLATEIKRWVMKQGSQLPGLCVLDAPMQVFEGHFLVPAPAPPAPTSVSSLCAALRSSACPSLQASLLQQLYNMAAASSQCKAELADHGVIETLLGILLTSADLARWYSAEILSFISLCPMLRRLILSAILPLLPSVADIRSNWFSALGPHRKNGKKLQKVLGSLCKRLVDGHAPEGSQAIAAWVLWVLSICEDFRSHLASKMILNALVHQLGDWCAVRAHGKDATVRVAAACVLRSIIVVPEAIPLIDICGVVPALVGVMVTGQDLERVAAASAVSNVARCMRDGRFSRSLCSPEVVSVTLDMLQSSEPQAARAGVKLLKGLMSQPVALPRLMSAPTVLGVMALLLGDNDSCLDTCCNAIRAMADRGGPQVRELLLAEGAAEKLAHLVRLPNERLQVSAARALRELCAPDTAAEFATPAMMGVVCDMLKEQLERVQAAAVSISLVVCQCKETANEVYIDDMAALHALLRMLSSHHSRHKQAAAALLRHLARSNINRGLVAKVGGVHALLDVLRHSPRCDQKVLRLALGALEAMAQGSRGLQEEIRSACKGDRTLPLVLVKLACRSGLLDGH